MLSTQLVQNQLQITACGLFTIDYTMVLSVGLKQTLLKTEINFKIIVFIDACFFADHLGGYLLSDNNDSVSFE